MSTDGMNTDDMKTDGIDTGNRLARWARHTRPKLLAAIGGGMVVALAAGGVAVASSGSPQPAPAAKASPSAHHAGGGHSWVLRLLRHTVHAQFLVRTKGGSLQTVDFDRGVLRSVTSTDIVIAPADSSTTTVSAAITSKTHFRGLTQSQLQPGDLVALVDHDGNAVVVGARAPKSTSSATG
jgi:hypothetical protein